MTTVAQPEKRKTTIEIDMQLLARAQEVLGTRGIKETIDKALHEAWRAEMRRQLLEQIRTGEGFDRGPEIVEQTRAAWTKRSE